MICFDVWSPSPIRDGVHSGPEGDGSRRCVFLGKVVTRWGVLARCPLQLGHPVRGGCIAPPIHFAVLPCHEVSAVISGMRTVVADEKLAATPVGQISAATEHNADHATDE